MRKIIRGGGKKSPTYINQVDLVGFTHGFKGDYVEIKSLYPIIDGYVYLLSNRQYNTSVIIPPKDHTATSYGTGYVVLSKFCDVSNFKKLEHFLTRNKDDNDMKRKAKYSSSIGPNTLLNEDEILLKIDYNCQIIGDEYLNNKFNVGINHLFEDFATAAIKRCFLTENPGIEGYRYITSTIVNSHYEKDKYIDGVIFIGGSCHFFNRYMNNITITFGKLGTDDSYCDTIEMCYTDKKDNFPPPIHYIDCTNNNLMTTYIFDKENIFKSEQTISLYNDDYIITQIQ